MNNSLQTLQLEGNYIGDAGAEALAEALKVVLGAQMLIFRLETCFLLHFLSFFAPSAVATPFEASDTSKLFVVLTNASRQSSMCFEPGVSCSPPG